MTRWLRALDAVVPPLVRAFEPDVPVTQHGCDTRALDPLAHLLLTVDGQRAAAERLHRLAHETASGRWVAFGGGGYETVNVVPRAWTACWPKPRGTRSRRRRPSPARGSPSPGR